MSVQRYDLNACIGCRNCINFCPMDVFRFDEKENKSVIAYVENCQSCGQCYVNCYGRSLVISNLASGYAITSHRATNTAYAAHTAAADSSRP
jgi:NAD-dependent dihydropyrimidine dehydrogenase PreA subunit